MKNTFPSIGSLIKEGDIEELTEALNNLHPFEIADLIIHKSEKEQSLIFGVLFPSVAKETFDYLPGYVQKNLLRAMPSMQAAALLEFLPPDDRTEFLQDLPRELLDQFMKLLPREERMVALTLLGYPEDSVGRLMTPDYLAVKMDWTVDKVLDHIRSYGHDSETIDIIYVVDEEGKLLDDIKLKDFLFISKTSLVKDIADYHFVSLSAYDNHEAAINAFKQYDRTALPVIDHEGYLVGIITVDDVLRLANQEATEDIQKMAGMAALNKPYMEIPFLELMKKRIGWLIVLFIGEMFTATALTYFENEIAKAVVLALFLPLIISTGGNAGSQSSTLVIRAMALGEVKLKDWWKIIRLEIPSGLFLGCVLGSVGFIRVTMWSLLFHLYGVHWPLVAATVGLSVVGVVLWGSFIGALFPFVLLRLGVDPATSASPFVAMIVDVTGIIIYFLVAMYVLGGTLL